MIDGLSTLAEKLAEHCKTQQMVLACAESCTGGLLSSTLVDVPGCSAWFDCGLVVYSDLAKQKMLGVDPKTLAHYGAVSKEVAQDLAQGLLQRSSANITVSITGIAGPDGGSDEKPVGTVWFAFASRHGFMKTAHHVFLGSRQEVRMQAVEFVLKELLQIKP